MTTVTYTAERELVGGHSQGTDYEFQLRCTAIDPDVDEKKKAARSLSGENSETVVMRRKKLWRVRTAAVTAAERDNMREFLESVSEGEAFTFDEFATVGVPDNALSVELDTNYNESRAVRQGDGGADDYFRYTFTIREK